MVYGSSGGNGGCWCFTCRDTSFLGGGAHKAVGERFTIAYNVPLPFCLDVPFLTLPSSSQCPGGMEKELQAEVEECGPGQEVCATMVTQVETDSEELYWIGMGCGTRYQYPQVQVPVPPFSILHQGTELKEDGCERLGFGPGSCVCTWDRCNAAAPVTLTPALALASLLISLMRALSALS